jgi:hypothetical protein
MISSEVQRTLVKSPPELWAEISDPDALARHLGEFGEIRITRVQPEQKVEWEADDASGSVAIKPSGWGTKVKLTVTRALPEISAPDPAPETNLAHEPEPNDEELDLDHVAALEHKAEVPAEPALASEIAPGVLADCEPALEDDVEAEPELEYETDEEPALLSADLAPLSPELAADTEPEPQPEPRRGFFARLFGRRRTARPADPVGEDSLYTEPDDDDELASEQPAERDEEPYDALLQLEPVLAPEPAPLAQPEPDDDPDALELPSTAAADDEPDDTPAPADISAEIEAAEEVAAEQVTAVLTGVLDRLGAAHHRPFSRS